MVMWSQLNYLYQYQNNFNVYTMVSVLSFFIVTFPSLNKVLWQDLISMHSFSFFMKYHIYRELGDDLLDHVWQRKGEFSSPCLFILQMRRYWESIKIYKPWKLCKWEERYLLLPCVCSTSTQSLISMTLWWLCSSAFMAGTLQ